MINRQIPENLKKYQAEILAGIAAAERRRIELSTAWGYPTSRPASPIVAPAQQLDQAAAARLEGCQSINNPAAISPGRDLGYLTGNLQALQHVKFWPLEGVAAAKHGKGGAWQAWTLAKSLDKPGLGAISLADLQALARDLDIPTRTWQRWLSSARRLTLINDRVSGDGWVVLASHAVAAVLLGCDDIGTRPASIRAGDLTGKGWRSYVWAAYEATHGGRPISRAKQEQLTGVPISTQRYHDNQAGVDRRANYAISDRPADQLEGVADFEDRAAPFKFYDKKRRRWVCAWRLPDCRSTSAAESLQRGRSRKISKAIKRLLYQRENGSFIQERAAGSDIGNAKAWRIFHRTGQQLRATERKIARADLQPAGEIYLRKGAGKRADFWHVVPLGLAV